MKRFEEEWRVFAKKADFERLAKTLQVSPYLVRILRNRDLTTEEEMMQFLFDNMDAIDSYEKLSSLLRNAKLMKDMEKGTKLLAEAIKSFKKIRIIGDYDVDGVSSIYILYDGIKRLTPYVDWRIPDRMKDGYGLNENFVKEAIADKVDLLVTCDNGIAAFDAIALAKDAGIQVIVTDHHDVPLDDDGVEHVPFADAVIDPKQADCPYPFDGICGAVVAWKLMGCLYEYMEISTSYIYQYTEIAAMATISDVMSLVDENRLIVKKGLHEMRRTRNLGLKALMEVQSIAPEALKAYNIGFVIGPMLNASGRLENASKAVNLLLSTDYEEALKAAVYLKDLNDARKQMTEEAINLATTIADTKEYMRMRVLVIFLEGCHESIAGIVAGRIRDLYNKPTIILTRDEQGEAKGSARSNDAYHMFQGLYECKEFLSKFGGHPKAAGLSLPYANVDAFRRAINERCKLEDKDFIKRTWIDIPLPPDYIDYKLIQELNLLEPIGTGNPGAKFAINNLKIVRAMVLGKNKNMLKLMVAYTNPNTHCTTTYEALKYGAVEQFYEDVREKYGEDVLTAVLNGKTNPINLSIIYKPEVNSYNGQTAIQLRLEAYRI